MIISLIVAMAENAVIGNNGKMPWGDKPIDGKRFYNLTVGKPIIMGRKTFEAVGGALPKRTNIILTQNRNYTAPKCVVVHSVKEALAAALSAMPVSKNNENVREIMIIGGAEIYKLFLPLSHRIYLTVIFHPFTGDTFFPLQDISNSEGWHSTNRELYERGIISPFEVMFDLLIRIPSINPQQS